MNDALSRRRFLQLSAAGAAAAAVGLAGCSSGGSDAATTASTSAPRRGSLRDVDHVVIMFQENRSFDQIFGTRPGSRGFGDPDVIDGPGGRPIWYQPSTDHPDGYVLPFPLTAVGPGGQCVNDVDHSWAGQHTAWNDGAMDGFARQMGPLAMGYYVKDDLPWYHDLADRFTLCDAWFCSVLGPTNPNRLMSMTGTIDPRGTGGGPAIDNRGTSLTWETYPERLQRAGVSWRVYQQVDDYGDNMLENFTAFQGLDRTDPLWDAGVRPRPITAFEEDCRTGNLPQVSWIVAPERQSEHAVWAPADGMAYVRRHLNAVFANPKVWAKTVFILSYDENGGFFDHVPPPVPERPTKDDWVDGEVIGAGMRVPGMVISPWSRGGLVNSDVVDHTSTLRFLETRFGVEAPLISAWRRDTFGDLTSTLDFSAFDPTVPELPDPTAQVRAVVEACKGGPRPVAPDRQRVPTVET